MAKKFNIDEKAKSYEPVILTLRDVDYVLGETAVQMFDITELADRIKTARDVFANVRPMLAILAPTAPLNLTLAEEMACVAPLQEVLESFSKLTFPGAPAEQGPAPAAG
jgi:hypothetical protein